MSNLSQRIADLDPEKRALLEERLKQQGETFNAFPLSFAQERLWFLDQLEPNSAYNIPTMIRLAGRLDVAALQAGLNQIVARHEALRTIFTTVEGRAVQTVLPELHLPLPVVDLRDRADGEAEARRLADDEFKRPFDLAKGPLLRATLLHLDDDYLLLLVMHHIVSDGWSMGVLVRELIACYRANVVGQTAALPTLPLQYPDFAVWQRQRLQGKRLDRQLAYWRQRLAGAPPLLELPTTRPRPPVKTSRGATYEWSVPRPLADALAALGQHEEATLFMTLLAAFYALLARYSGQDDMVIGAPVAGRTRPEIEGLIGFFVNTLALRADLSGNPTFRELVRQVRNTYLEAYEHQDLPFERLVEALQPARDLSYTPVFQVLFALQNAPLPALDVPNLTITPIATVSQAATFDLALTVTEHTNGLIGRFEYNTDLFDETMIATMATHLGTLLAGAVENPDRRVWELPLLSDAEREQALFAWNNTGAPLPDHTFVARFEKQAARAPDRIALRTATSELSYAALNRRANQLAHVLRARGVVAETRVAVCLDRSLDLVVAILGVLKAGGVYLPLDPAYPAARLNYVLVDAEAALLLTRPALLANDVLAMLPDGLVIDLDAEREVIDAVDAANLAGEIALDQAAYLIYTSGSTGRPKGVVVAHRGISNLADAQIAAFGMHAASRVLQFASPSFDAAISEMTTTLLAGATLYLASDAARMPGTDLLSLLREQRITTVTLPPSVLAALPDAALPELETIIAAGEACPAAVAERWSAGRRFLNAYGPTEATVCATISAPVETAGVPPIGRPIANVQVYVLDRAMNPVPVGSPGELYVGGTGLARGYLGRPDLTAARFVPDPFSSKPGARLYRTGDRARQRADGQIAFLGRVDEQVKLRGYRIELGEIAAVLREHPAVREAALTLRAEQANNPQLVAYVVARENSDGAQIAPTLRDFLHGRLPEYMLPAAFVVLDALPLSPNGKLDQRGLPALAFRSANDQPPQTELEHTIATVWRALLHVDAIGRDTTFFELGGHSLLMAQAQHQLAAALGREIAMVDLFRYPTVGALAQFLSGSGHADDDLRESHARARSRRALLHGAAQPVGGTEIAVIGMHGRFPGAADINAFWQNLCAGAESIRFFSEQELLDAGVSPATLAQPGYVRASAPLDDIELFDADFFGYSPREAEIMDPQQRLFLECAWAALEHAGYAPNAVAVPTGVYAGVSMNRYWLNLMSNQEAAEALGGFHTVMANDRDFLTTRVSHKLNLRGPSMNVQTACSTSLVAIHLACQALLHHECDMALAGGVSVAVPSVTGYLHQEGGIQSPDGHCRAFDAQAQGTVAGSGMGLVVLKRLEDALHDGDQIYAVVKGSAINNDGAQKVSYTAPSVDGQADVIAEALALAAVAPDTIGYVEAHGTGTPLGDPIEIAALTRAFRADTERNGFCAIGSLKTNIGHLDAAAGVAGFIKATLALAHAQIPPSLHYDTPNPQINFASSPFYVNHKLADWSGGDTPRRAGVSSFGIGGTNAHVVLEEAPRRAPSAPGRAWQPLVLSAKTDAALEAATDRLAAYLREHPQANLADVAYTLQAGRSAFDARRMLVCRDAADAADALERRDPQRLLGAQHAGGARPVVFMFPGGGGQHAGMARELYGGEPVFREWIDRCAELLQPILNLDIRAVLFPSDADAARAAQQLRETALALPALFLVEYALAQLWMAYGVRPQALTGHSLGEYVAACLSGVFSLEDALALVATRGRLMQGLPAGRMLSVALPEAELRGRLDPRMSLAAVNGPALCVVSGPSAAVSELEHTLRAEQIECRRIPIDVAAHSALVEPILEAFAARVQTLRLQPPQIPCISGVTGTWLSAAEATDPGYWVRHLRQTVRFADGIAELLHEPNRILLEVGPGRALSGMAQMQATPERPVTALASLPSHHDQLSDSAFVCTTLGRLWLAGAVIDWPTFQGGGRQRVALPTYPFQRQRYWIARKSLSGGHDATGRALVKRPDVGEWLYVPSWKRTALPPMFAPDQQDQTNWLVFLDDTLGATVVQRLREAGQSVVAVQQGAQFARQDEHAYLIDPDQPTHYAALLADLKERGLNPTRIVHLWSVAPATSFDQAQRNGFYSLIFLAQALEQERFGDALDLALVSNGVLAVTGDELLSPEKATLLGPARVIGQEYPQIHCRTIDIALPDGSRQARVAEQLLAELGAHMPERTVAYRGGYRWVESYEQVPRGEPQATPRLRQNGVYMITGGLGLVGLALADELARAVQARLVLVGRSALPDREIWEYWLATHDQHDTISVKIHAIQSLEAQGASVLTLSADVADQTQMQAVVERVEREYGALHGVVHAAGATGEQAFRAIQALGPTESEWQFHAKVHALPVLEAVLADRQLDFCVLCSSLSALLGGLGFSAYAAANLFMDAFAHRHNQTHAAPWISVNWEGWQPAQPERRVLLGTSLLDLAITAGEGGAVLQQVIGLPATAQVIVSSADLAARRARSTAHEPQTDAPTEAAETPPLHPRRNIPTPYVAPTTELEGRIAQICENLLGIAPVGIHDNFFDLGGHSLLAVQLVSRLRAECGAEVSLHTMFESPTVAQLAASIAANPAPAAEAETLEEMLQMVEQLSEDEIATLLFGGQE